jgi:endoglucanase
MKKFLALLVTLCIAASMSSCYINTIEEEPAVGQTIEEVTETASPTESNEPEKEVQPTETPAETQPVGEEEKGNMLLGGYFEKLSPNWGTYTESGGEATVAVNADEQLEVRINNTGSVKHAAQVYCDGFKLLQNAEYKIAFSISSTMDRHMDWRIQLNTGDYRAYASMIGYDRNLLLP